ncbi:unnamed protein product [Lactuca saligna]|uniref:U6 snRNA phosphodiesterase 1 n=1 Tax=Lactuca saligna TaxID=75948 RepID=A0AA35ZN73_LACSI|nr:unnamed protein product [Lactuca saligna]
MTELETFDLCVNYLDGEIPLSLAGLSGLKLLNVSYNNFYRKNPDMICMIVGLAVGFWITIGTLIVSKQWRDAYYHFLDEMRIKFANFILHVCTNVENTTRGVTEVTKQIQVVNEVYKLHNLPEFYKDPQPHISIAWGVGDISESVKRVVEGEMRKNVGGRFATKSYKKIVVADDMVTYPIHLIRPIDPFICLSNIFF